MTPIVLTGTAVTFDDERRVLKAAAVYINGDTIEAVLPASSAAPAGFSKARRVPTNGFIYPGLIDLHSHLAYNFLPLWSAPRDVPYVDRYTWANPDTTYGRDVGRPAEAMGIAAAAAALRYAEVKAVVGGVTSIQGSPPTTRPFPGWMVRNVEKEQLPTQPAKQAVYQSVIPKMASELSRYGKLMDDGSAFIYHLAEGTAAKLRAEYTLLADNDCAREGLIGIHCTALKRADYIAWRKKAGGAGTVVWSPFSNIWLYGDTTDVLAARRHGMRVCLGSDWSPSGSRNLLGELKVAALWNDSNLDGALSAQELCEMATRAPGLALEAPWGRVVGRLEPGALADIAVTSNRDTDPYRSLLAANERHVRLVVVGGQPAYGTGSLLERAGVRGESIVVAGVQRRVRMKLPRERQPDDPDLRAAANLSWKAGLARLEAVRRDPAGEVKKARATRAFGVEPLEFVPDMPGFAASGEVTTRRLDDDELAQLAIPPIEPLAHDRAWFDAVEAGHEHASLLRRLRALS